MQVQNDNREQRRRAQLQGTRADLLRVNMVLVRMMRRQEAGEAMGICSRRKERRVRETLVAGLLRCAFGPNTTTAPALSPTRTSRQGCWQLPGGQEHACMHVIHQPPPYPPPSLHSPTDPSHPVVGYFLSTPQDTSISAAVPCWTWRISKFTPSGSQEHAQARCFPQFHFSPWPVLERRLQHHQDTSHFRVSFTRQRQLRNPSELF